MLIEFCNTDGAVLSERQLHLDENEHLEYLLTQFRDNGWSPTTRRTDDGEIVNNVCHYHEPFCLRSVRNAYPDPVPPDPPYDDYDDDEWWNR
jgi:hypothetical protein